MMTKPMKTLELHYPVLCMLELLAMFIVDCVKQQPCQESWVFEKAWACNRITAEGRLASNCFDAWANTRPIMSSHTERRTLDCMN